ncbi:MAG: pyridoxamine 5'-phosphate oxidase family protein [Dehalococcoidia bacterium]
MANWAGFAAEAPEMAARGREIMYFAGIGLGYLATVRPDGGPRLHPFCPIQRGDGLYGLIIPGPKRRDLLRDPRVAIHTQGMPDRDDELALTGTARPRDDAVLLRAVEAAFLASGGHSRDHVLFEFDIESALLVTYGPRGESTSRPRHLVWRAGSPAIER